MENQEEIDEFLDEYNPPKLSKEVIETLNQPIAIKETEAAIKSLSSLGPDVSQVNFIKTL